MPPNLCFTHIRLFRFALVRQSLYYRFILQRNHILQISEYKIILYIRHFLMPNHINM